MIVHGVAHDIGRFVGPAVIHLVQHPEDTPLHRFQPVIHIGNGPVFDDISRIIQKIAVHHRPEIGVGISIFADSGFAVGFRFGNHQFIRSFIHFITHIWTPPDLS